MKRQIILILSLFVLTLFGSNLSIQAVDLHPTLSESPLAEKSVVEGEAALQTAYSQAIGQDDAAYHFQYHAAHYSAYNDAHDLDIVVDDVTVTIAIAEDIWQITSTASATGFSLEDNRLTIHHEGYDEWYVNSPMGLQQGFTLYEPSDISFDVGGTLTTTASTHSLNIGDELTFSGLMAFDVEGKDLPVQFELKDKRLAYVYDDTNAMYPVTIDPWVQQFKLTIKIEAAYSYFGASVAMDGNTVLIGTPARSYSGCPTCQAVYVFVYDGVAWTQQAKLAVSGSIYFGVSVALEGDTAVVGDPDAICSRGYCGAAYVFTRSGTTWSQQAKLTPADDSFVSFGLSVALSGDTILVGDRNQSCGADIWCGAAYVFTRSGTTWSQQAKLTPADIAYADYFGSSVAIDGDTAAIGAYGDDCAGADFCGSVDVFVRSGTTWTEQGKLSAGTDLGNLRFGSSVDMNGDTLLIGAPAPFNSSVGRAYVYVRNGTSWTWEARLLANDYGSNDEFGASISLDGDSRAIIGAAGNFCGNYEDCGSAYIFERTSPGTWSQIVKIKPDDIAPGDEFGSGVAMVGNTVIAGAQGANCAAGYDCGTAYIFGWTPTLALSTSATCAGPNLWVTISGDGPFDITASAGINMPVLGVNEGTTAIGGPEKWDDVTVTETTGDLESVNLGQFKCRQHFRPEPLWPEHRAHLTNPQPTFIWKPIPDANDYRIFLFDDPDVNIRTVDIRENSGGGTQMTLSQILLPGRYFWRVRGRVNRVWSYWSVRFTLFIDPVVIAPAVQVNTPVPTLELSTPLPPNSPPDSGPPPTVEASPATDLPVPPNSR